MRFATLGSGSGGNAAVVEHAGCALLIDCGLSVRQIELRIRTLGLEPGAFAAILITHEHDDHIAAAGAMSRKYRLPVLSSAGTRRAAAARLLSAVEVHEFLPGATLHPGPFAVLPVIVPHDAREPCQFVIDAGGCRLGMLTDLGQATPHLERHYGGLDALMLEFNHDPELLRRSAYPASLQARIGGDFGHLSNEQAEALLGRLDCSALRCVTAAHLSEKTNSPAHVRACLTRALAPTIAWQIAHQASALPWFALDA